MKKTIDMDIAVSVDYNSKYRFVLFLELTRFLFDFLSFTLIVRRNYYQSFVKKANDLEFFFNDKIEQKAELKEKNFNLAYGIVAIKERIF